MSEAALPPGPQWPRIIQSVAMIRFRHQFMPWAHRRYGDRFSLRVLGGRRLVIFSRAEDIREIFSGNPDHLNAGKANVILKPMMGEHSVLLVDGDEHRRARRLLMPAFNGAALRGYADLVGRIAKGEVDGWHDGDDLPALDRMNALTLEVILQVVFGVTDEERLDRMRPLVRRVVDVPPWLLVGTLIPGMERLRPWQRFLGLRDDLDTLLFAEIADRRTAPDLAERTDVLSRLLHVGADAAADEQPLTDVELRDQLVTLLLAGHETTASSLAWALYELGRDHDQLARAQRAVTAGDDTWLEAVLKESMRLHPVIPQVVRTLSEPTEIGGVTYPRGVTLAASILLAHDREDNHPDARAFDPARFTEQHGNRVGPAANTWIPFGGGVRRCIGAGFSLMEGVEVLREVLSRYDVTALGTEQARVRNITSVPAGRARVRVTPRRG